MNVLNSYLFANAIVLVVIIYVVGLSRKCVSPLLYPDLIEDMKKYYVPKWQMILELTVVTLFCLPALLVWYIVIVAPSSALVWLWIAFITKGDK